jgi:hypothetical protein
MKNHTEFSQLGEYEEACLPIEASLLQKEERILRRASLEILPFLHPWCERKNSLTQMAIRETLKRHSLYEQAPKEQWKGILEDFTEKELEVLFLKKTQKPSDLLSLSFRKNPIKERLEELEDLATETLLFIWTQETGLLSATCGEMPSHFPEIGTLITFKTSLPETPKLWAWDHKNFKQHL